MYNLEYFDEIGSDMTVFQRPETAVSLIGLYMEIP